MHDDSNDGFIHHDMHTKSPQCPGCSALIARLRAEITTLKGPPPKKYRKRPVVVEAVWWSGQERDIANVMQLFKDGLPDDGVHVRPGLGYTPGDGRLYIPTLEGEMTASPGDWIIRGVKGEVYPCKPDVFKEIYDEVTP